MREGENWGKYSTQQLIKRAIDVAKEGRWHEAISVNQEIIEIRPDDVDAHNRLGKAYMELGEINQAKESYKKALELDPKNNIAKRNFQELHRKMLAVSSSKQSISEHRSLVTQPQLPSDKAPHKPRFDINTRVYIKSSESRGLITEILPNRQYRIYLNEYEQPVVSEEDLEAITTYFNFVTPRDFLKDLLIFKLRRPLSDTLYSYSMSRTNFEAYQFKPVIKFLTNPNSRILIADEVGLGKTIEACIVYLELKARMQGDLPRVLVVCPAGLRNKWQTELMSRFGEEFEIMDRNRIDRFFTDYENFGPTARLRGICSLESLRYEQLSSRIVETGTQFDLVVIDEAHHMRNPETLSFDLGETLSEHADSLILLTATPVHLQSLDLFYLLNILDPGQFESPELFEYQLEPNKLLNRAISRLGEIPPNLEGACKYLESCSEQIKENPFYTEARTLIGELTNNGNTIQYREKLASAIRYLYQLNTFSLIFNRTRRKEVMRGALREASVINVPLTHLEAEIYSTAMKFARARAQYIKGYASVLGLIQIERQLASSLGAFKEIIEDFEINEQVEIDIESSSPDLDDITSLPSEEVNRFCKDLRGLYSQLGQVDSKFDNFYRELMRLLDSDPRTKIIVYSFFRRTLAYLHRRLTLKGHKVEVIHGGKEVRERHVIIDRFSQEDDIRILLSSEVGAEGLDLQFCNAIINYDLPWNPMRVEQRIGRIDRYGQKSEKVKVVSLFLNDTIEPRILQRLYVRIGVFEESIGGLEPILGEIVRELSYEVISSELTEEQEEKRTEEYLRMLEHRRMEIEDFESHRYELMGQDTVFIQQVEDNIASGRFVSSKEIRALISSYIDKFSPRSRLEEVDRPQDNWLLVPDHTLIDKLRAFFTSKTNRPGGEDWQFLSRLQNCISSRGRLFTTAPRVMPITFNSNLALERPLLEFIHVWHPLVRLAYRALAKTTQSDPETRMLKFMIRDDLGNKSGLYYFFLFCLSSRAIVNSDELIAVVSDVNGNIDQELSEGFLKILNENLSEESPQPSDSFNLEMFQKLKSRALGYMSNVKNEREVSARQRNDSLIATRRAAIEKTFEAKKRRAESRLEKATDSRIIRMHQGEIRNLESKLQNAIAELEAKKQVSVVYEPIAYGLMEIQSNNQ